ncbi:hypothetical protein ACVJBD_005837 [Rhizobium mongolense]
MRVMEDTGFSLASGRFLKRQDLFVSGFYDLAAMRQPFEKGGGQRHASVVLTLAPRAEVLPADLGIPSAWR